MTGYVLQGRFPGLELIRLIRLDDAPITGHKFAVLNLIPSTQYEFRVAAVNEIGIGGFSEASELITTKAPSIPDTETLRH